MEITLGMLGAILIIAAFTAGFLLGKGAGPKKYEEEESEIIRQRQKLIEEQNAFHDLMNYNSDVAYGLVNANLTEK